MDKIHTHDLDLKSLRILVLLLKECSVTRTAELTGQPQPSISLCLKRLRDRFKDPLLVRNGNQLVPTTRGRDLAITMTRILADLDREFMPEDSFDPLKGPHHFKLLLSNCFGPTFIPRIISSIRQQSPGAVIDVCPMPAYEQIAPLVAAGTVDIALGNWPSPPDALRKSSLFQSDIVGLVNGKSSLARHRRLSIAQYLAADHLSLTPSGNAAMSPIDGRLAELGLARSICASVPDYGSVPYVLSQTNMMFSTSRHFAEELASLVPLSVVELPEAFGPISFYALWHERSHRSPAHEWLRGVIRKVAREMDAIRAAPSTATIVAG